MRIAAAQTAPVWGNKSATADRIIEWIQKAADDGVDLLAFGETFLSGYPFWVARTDGARWEADDQKAAYGYYLDAAVALCGPELTSIAGAVAATGVFTYLGITELSPSRGTVYATLVGIDPSSGIVSAHRKLMPTYEERLVWGTGDGHGLQVHDLGRLRVGGLNCWENWVPTARHALYSQGMDLHVAAWPGSVELTEDITRFIAREGRCFVLSVGSLLRPRDIPEDFPLRHEALAHNEESFYNGGSAIAGPDGRWIVEPVADEERLVTADIDVASVGRERQNFDPAGHYFRGDVFEINIDRRRLDPAVFTD